MSKPKDPIIFVGHIYDLPKEFLQAHPDVNWEDLTDFRNVMIHQYFEIDVDAIWAVINKDLPVLEARISKLLEK